MGTLKLLYTVLLTLGLGRAGSMRPASRQHCLQPGQLESGSRGLQKLLGRTSMERLPSVTLVKQLEQQKEQQHQGCPNLQQYSSLSTDYSHRSISPWQYRIDHDENRYPPKLAFAHCLCDGCIDAETGEETLSLNSVPLEQTMLVLQRQTCPGHPGWYSFNLMYIKVPIACTCVLPRNSQ
ncbi:interleukin-17C [Scyliorhinus torazame]|uniref:interleukin-17C n=1 Tax=Scyliorhinus torazame TaxID=75743 RepID=UPI003B5AF8D9